MGKKFKNSAVDLTDLALAILILGITVSIGATVLINIRNNRVTDLTTGSVNNESVTSVTNAGNDLSQVWVNTVNTCINGTGGEIIPATNYTLAVDANFGTGTITPVLTSAYNNSNWNCTYTIYNTSDPQYSLPNDAATGLAEYGNWFDIIVIVGVAAVILSLIFMAFGRRGSSGTSY